MNASLFPGDFRTKIGPVAAPFEFRFAVMLWINEKDGDMKRLYTPYRIAGKTTPPSGPCAALVIGALSSRKQNVLAVQPGHSLRLLT
jgi:hypothetical protein